MFPRGASSSKATLLKCHLEGLCGDLNCFHLAAIIGAGVGRGAARDRGRQPGGDGPGSSGTSHRSACLSSALSAAYGANDDLPLKEQAVPQPLSPYAADKLSKRASLARPRGVPWSKPQPPDCAFNVYGPRQVPVPYSRSRFDLPAGGDRRAGLIIYGDGDQSAISFRDQDVTRFLVAAMDRASASRPVVNVCTGHST